MARQLGDTGIAVFDIGLGAMPLSIHGRPGAEQADAVVRSAVDAGVTFIDTANVYCLNDADIGHNERLLARSLKAVARRTDIVVATKGGLTRPRGSWQSDARPDSLRQACERSLRDLGVDCITLYQLHAPDSKVPFEDSVGALAHLREEGKIRHVGLSNVGRNEIERAAALVPVTSVQNRCNVIDQGDVRSGLVEFCAERGITYIPYSPVGGHHGHARLAKQPKLARIAERHHASVYALALAWLLAQGPHVLPIPGASRVESIRDSVRAPGIVLSADDLTELGRLPEG